VRLLVLYLSDSLFFLNLQACFRHDLTVHFVSAQTPPHIYALFINYNKNYEKTFEGLTQGLWAIDMLVGERCNPAKDCVHLHHDTHSNYCHCDMDTRLTTRSAVRGL
jgi:hypothetical protein